jgi:putative phosphoserine phosphatase/1-acylglycerol-3-phosphate O-acyltransferase
MLKGWPIRNFDRAPGIVKIGGRELQEWARPFMRPEMVASSADVRIEGVEHIPSSGPAIVVFNHRSYFDPTVMGLVIAKAGRNIRGLGKKEVFDVPLVGQVMKAMGGIRVDRGTGSDEPLEAAIAALQGGDLLMLAPEGTIPRGPAFFDPELKGRWGAARLAAATHAPVIPVGLWGTEKVWPRSARLPRFAVGPERPVVTATVGPEITSLKYKSPDADTKRIMKAISALLPPESQERRTPTADELALTYPPGYKGDPNAEAERRPGTDT